MEASALSHASRRGLLPRRSRLLRLQTDDRLVALVRAGNDSAFEVLWDRYRARLLAYCKSIVRSAEDAEDVLQDVFVNAHAAMVADRREIHVRPWLYRIARNRSLNQIRKAVADGQDTMDDHLHAYGETAHDQAERREGIRQLVADVKTLPETQRTALVLREIDALSYDEIAEAMETTIPSVKSLLVRARISLAETSESRLLTCDEVRVELAAAAEGLAKVAGAMRRHVRECESCQGFRKQLQNDGKALAALSPIGFATVVHALLAKLFGGATGGTAAAGGSAAAAGAAGSGAIATGGAGGGAILGGIGGAIGIKAAATAATAAIITAGAVEVSKQPQTAAPEPAPVTAQGTQPAPVVLNRTAGHVAYRGRTEPKTAGATERAKAGAEAKGSTQATAPGAVAPATTTTTTGSTTTTTTTGTTTTTPAAVTVVETPNHGNGTTHGPPPSSSAHANDGPVVTGSPSAPGAQAPGASKQDGTVVGEPDAPQSSGQVTWSPGDGPPPHARGRGRGSNGSS